MGESSINGRNTLSSNNHTHNDSVCDSIFTQGYGTPWYRVSPPVKPLYEVVVMDGYWYGYKRVGSDT